MARLPDRDGERIGKSSGIIRIIVGIFIAAITLTLYTAAYTIHRIKEKLKEVT